jgi:hypothetical protein
MMALSIIGVLGLLTFKALTGFFLGDSFFLAGSFFLGGILWCILATMATKISNRLWDSGLFW